MTEEVKQLNVRIPISLDKALEHYVVEQDIGKAELVVASIEAFLRTNLTWEQSKRFAKLRLAIIKGMENVTSPILVELDPPSALILFGQLAKMLQDIGLRSQMLEALGIKKEVL